METRRMCPHCRAFISTKDRTCPYCHEEVEPRRAGSSSGGPALGGLIPQAHFTTVLLITINIGLYLAMTIYSLKGDNPQAFMDLDTRTLIAFGAKFTPAIALGQYWRLVLAGFLHLNLLHILMNMWVLFDLGATVEEFYGTARFIVIYFVATVAGFYASAVFSPALSAGASAGLFGLIGAMIALGVRDRTGMGGAIRGMYIRWAIYVTIIGFFLGADHAAHFGGGLAGFALAFLGGTPSAFGGTRESVWKGLAVASIALTAVSFVLMVSFLVSARL
ncbi:MAG: rhomboid family intramembrane serine protease [Bryobacteraceae bacterium]|nr:rhomboid family intramembrane serine protease [Bryobacteraceae bacterium]